MIAEGDAGAIEDVSETLLAVLEDGIGVDQFDVVVASPDDVKGKGSPTVGLFLYDVVESGQESSLRPEEVGPDTQRLPPLVVDLHYLVTAYPSGSGNETQKAQRAHELLGEAMWALRRNGIVTGSALRGSLDGRLRIARGETDDTLLDIWGTFADTSFIPSVAYTVGPVALAAAPEEPLDRVETFEVRGEHD